MINEHENRKMSNSTCDVRIKTREQKLICSISVNLDDTVEVIKSKIIVLLLKLYLVESNYQEEFQLPTLLQKDVSNESHCFAFASSQYRIDFY